MIGDWFNNENGLTGEQLVDFIKENNLEDKIIFRTNGCTSPLLITSIQISEYSGNIIVS